MRLTVVLQVAFVALISIGVISILLNALLSNSSQTVPIPANPPKMLGGFDHLQEAAIRMEVDKQMDTALSKYKATFDSQLKHQQDEFQSFLHGLRKAQPQQNGNVVSNMDSDAPKEGDTFAPGSLDLTRLETFRRCYVDPQRYKKHFVSQFCSVADKYKLVYHLLPKSGSSTGRHVMKHSFGASEDPSCRYKLQARTNGNPDMEFHFSIMRNPLSRFFASYEEMFVRRLGRPAKVPAQYRRFANEYEGMEYKEYEKLFSTAEGVKQLTRSFETFVEDYDGKIPFDEHLRLQIPPLADPVTGKTYALDSIFDTHNMVQHFEEIAKQVSAPVPSVIRGRSYPRRLNTSDIDIASRVKLCQLSAIDFCCLNYPLPPECAAAADHGEVVNCRWISRPELSKELMIEAVSPVPPAE